MPSSVANLAIFINRLTVIQFLIKVNMGLNQAEEVGQGVGN